MIDLPSTEWRGEPWGESEALAAAPAATDWTALPGTIEHGFTHFALTLYPQRVSVARWPLRAETPQYVWLSRDDALQAALPAPIRKLLRTL